MTPECALAETVCYYSAMNPTEATKDEWRFLEFCAGLRGLFVRPPLVHDRVFLWSKREEGKGPR